MGQTVSNELKDCVKAHSKASNPLDQLLLFYLADYSNGLGYAYPTLERMVRETHIPRRTLQRRITNLEAIGALTVDRGGKRSRGVERRASRYYVMCGSEGASHGTLGRVTNLDARVPNRDTRVSAGASVGARSVRDVVRNTRTQEVTQAVQDLECPDCLSLRERLPWEPTALCPPHFHEGLRAREIREGLN